jgi:hypothetical protein
MCGFKGWSCRNDEGPKVYDAETLRLDAPLDAKNASTLPGWRVGFPWWTLWMIWPLMGLIKAAIAAVGPLLVLLTTPVALEVTLLPLLLILLGAALVLFGRRTRR